MRCGAFRKRSQSVESTQVLRRCPEYREVVARRQLANEGLEAGVRERVVETSSERVECPKFEPLGSLLPSEVC